MPDFSLLEKIPGLWYPLGSAAYDTRLSECISAYGMVGTQSHCFDLLLWHALLHLFGALLFVFLIAVVSRCSKAIAVGASVLFAGFFLWLELIDQPVRLQETYFKAVTDIVLWLGPLAIFWTTELFKKR